MILALDRVDIKARDITKAKDKEIIMIKEIIVKT